MNNVDNFKQSFREEAREILVDLESALLELNENRDDQEIIGRVFRALHTLKGSGAMFGFDELAAFTHNLETAFDEVRNGRLQVNSELIDLTLTALDQIKALLEEGPGGTVADPAVRDEILAKLRQITLMPKATRTFRTGAGFNGERKQQGCDWQIKFTPGPELMLDGTNPLLLLNELKQIGNLRVQASMAAIPPIAELAPERCYVSWE